MITPRIFIICLLALLGTLQAQDLPLAQVSSELPSVATPPQSPEPGRKALRKAYRQKLLRVSPRVSYGFGTFRSHMQYNVPDLGAAISDAANALRTKYPWVPWKEVNLDLGEDFRIRQLEKKGTFFITAGLNLPLIFVDISAGLGRFSEPLLTVRDVMPPWKLLRPDEIGALLFKRVTTAEGKGSISMRLGVELERVLPDRWLPRFNFGSISLGVDGSAYYLIGADMSYRTGLELIDPQAVEHLAQGFEPIPFISQKAKHDAAEAILGHVEASLPTYFWLPAFRGFGVSGRVYVDIGARLRISARYHHEQARGMRVQQAEWLQRGPQLRSSSLTLAIESRL